MNKVFTITAIMILAGCAIQVPESSTPESKTSQTFSTENPTDEVTENPSKNEPKNAPKTTPKSELKKDAHVIEKLHSDGTYFIGSESNPNTLQIFTEYHCEFCKDFHTQYLGWLKNEYVKTGQLNLEISIYPL